MKIFALNLSLQFDLWQPEAPYQFLPTSLEEVEAELQAPIGPPRQRYVRIGQVNVDSFAKQLFDLQSKDAYRAHELALHLLFDSFILKELVLKTFLKKFRTMTAAGGLVVNEENNYLCIYNRGCWTLPKGKVEKGETIEEAAVREVQEETGLHTVVLTEKAGETYHTFLHRKGWTLKTTHWYRMKGDGTETLIPQAEEHIEDVRWMSQSEWLQVASQSYPLNRELFEAEFAKNLLT